MDFSGLFFLGTLLTYTGIIVYVANQVDLINQQPVPVRAGGGRTPPETSSPRWLSNPVVLRWLLYGLIVMMFVLGLTVFQLSMLGEAAMELDEALPVVSPVTGILTFAAAAAVSLLSYRLVASETLRQQVGAFLNRLGGSFKPDSQVHLVALLLMLAVVIWTLANFIMSGGVEGLAQDMTEDTLSAEDVIFQAVLEIVITLLGVGLAIRRDIPQTLQRLGLQVPTGREVLWGAGIGVVLLVFMNVFSQIWGTLVPVEVIEEQTSAAEALNLAFATLPLAFILSVSAAVGEEIWIRGGLQPIFGLWVSSLFFASLHIQVAFTPAILILFVVSLGMGWLRHRFSTMAAIVAHFCFNFIPLALLALSIGAA